MRSRGKTIQNRTERLYDLNVMSVVGAVRGSVQGAARSKPFSLTPGEFGSVYRNFFLLSDHYQGHSDLHVKLVGLPRTTTPADITRLLGRNKVHNITKGACEVSTVPLAHLTC